MTAIASALVPITGFITPANAAVSVTVQHCSTSKATCVDQTVDNNGEICAIVKRDSTHKANLCIWDHSWGAWLNAYVDGRAETCIGQNACVGVDHFHWINGQIILWRLNDDGSYNTIETGSSDIPSTGNTGPTDTLYTTGDYEYSYDSTCDSGSAIKTHTEVQLRIYWKAGTNTTVLTFNSDNFCHH